MRVREEKAAEEQEGQRQTGGGTEWKSESRSEQERTNSIVRGKETHNCPSYSHQYIKNIMKDLKALLVSQDICQLHQSNTDGKGWLVS